MTMLLLQIFLLLLAAYLLGAFTACILKRALFASRAESEDLGTAVPMGADPRPAVAGTGAATQRFERALTGEAASGPAPSRTAPVVEVQPTAKPAAPVAPSAPAPAAAPASAAKKSAGEQAAIAVAASAATAAASAAATAFARPAPPPPPPAAAARPAPQSAPPTQPAPASQPVPSSPPQAAPASPPAPQPVARPAPVAAAPARPATVDDLTRIRAIDGGLQSRLNGLGVYRFAEIAKWSAGDVNRMSQSLGFAGRIEQENWIEQAQILAKGGETSYSRRQTGPGASSAPAGTATPSPATTAAAAATAVAAATSAAKMIGGEAAPAAAEAAPRPVKLADAIKEQQSTAKAAPGLSEAKSAPAPAPAPAADSRADYSHLRSVRSEALRSEPPPSPISMGQPEDLKRIRGIGVLIEKKLNGLGITSYEQIANWTGADVERYGQHIEPRGRIERENWIEQARILASGGQTDYARRFDRGEFGPTG